MPPPDRSHPDLHHPDPDDLALVALGENLDDAAQSHIAGCSACAAQVESFRGTIDLAGLSDYGRDAPSPGAHVWAAISADLGFTLDPAGAAPTAGAPTAGDPDLDLIAGDSDSAVTASGTAPVAAAPPATAPQPAAPPRADATPISGAGLRAVPTQPVDAPPAGAGPRRGAARRWTRWVAPIAATVVGIALGAGAVVLVQNRENSVTVDATAPLNPVQGGPLPPSDGQLGTAELVTARTGQQVRVDASGLPATTSSSYEVWLFGDDGRMVSLGTLADGSGSFTVPAGIDTSQYRTVDISDEPPDGNPAHSGISLVRGTFA